MHGSVRPRVTPSPAPARQDGAARSAVPVALLSAAVGTLGAGAAALAWGGVAALVVVGAAGVAAGAFALAWARGLDQERARLEARLAAVEAARARAEADNLAKSRFLAEMSHELRTPLNTVMGFSEMMADEVLGPHRVPAYGGYARDILASGRHLLALADDLLDLARIESGHRVLLETPVHLGRLGQECLAMLRPDAASRRLTLRVEPAEGAPARLWGDERAVRQIILNLLANAVKFTPQDGEVRLVTGIDASGAPFLAVEDTGAGVSERELPLEDARHRESRLDVKSGRGAGLGLAIVRALATLHGGELSLTRRAAGGTRARVVFPKSRALDAPLEATEKV
ncbi:MULTISPECIES: HAMP domain-containing sensor histidine kinase [unclassified Xanthobacter]|uniref:sensor histidine kinase n=2 Tax=Xanthobacter TaxID=279 RepID=UPI001F428974|nr:MULTISPECIES: ATP-binding protein [unclassified Xanthobacter]